MQNGFFEVPVSLAVCEDITAVYGNLSYQAGGVSWIAMSTHFASGTMTSSCFLVRSLSNFISSYQRQP